MNFSSTITDQRGYGGIAMFLWAVVVGFAMYYFMYPDTFHPQPSTGCAVGQAPEKYEEIKDLPEVPQIIPQDQNYALGEGVPIGGPNLNTKADFVLIRKNVPLPEKSEIDGYEFLGKDLFSYSTHTAKIGERPEKPGYTLYYPTWGALRTRVGEFSFLTESIIFFVNDDPNSMLILGGQKIRTADIYQEKTTYENKNKKYTTEDLFVCERSIQGAFFVPTLAPSHAPNAGAYQEQLDWFLFNSIGFWSSHCKPAIYLYPEKETRVNVQVAIPQGELLYTDPTYPVDGWNVLAKPNGALQYLGKNLGDSKGKVNYADGVLPYLYYEGRIADSAIEKPTKGFVKKYEELASFFDEILPKLGLNQKESQEFKDYWLKALPKALYYFIGIVPQSNLNEIEPLTITPQQDTTIRISLYFEQREKFSVVTPPTLKTPTRKGFTVVEWGGMVKRDKDHPFTCVQ